MTTSSTWSRWSWTALLGGAGTVVPCALYLLSGLWVFVMILIPLVIASVIAGVFAAGRKQYSAMAACFIGPVVAFTGVRGDLWLLKRAVVRSGDCFAAAGQQAIEMSDEQCGDGVPRVGVVSGRCEIQAPLARACPGHSDAVMVTSSGGAKMATFALRPGSRKHVAVTPGRVHPFCPPIGHDVFLCGFNGPW